MTPAAGALRERFLAATTLAWVWLAVGTELLGARHNLTRAALAGWWGVGLLLGLAALRPWRRLGSWRPRLPSGPAAWLLTGLSLFAFCWTLAQALRFAPNNVDSLLYHLPRQVYWLQSASVSHFPTSDLRQLTMPPLAEYAGLQLFVLTGGDQLHNLIQWSALVGTAAAVSLLTLDIGGTPLVQLFSVTLLLSAPPVLVQASNTKNDLVVALWLTSSVVWTLRLGRAPSPGLPGPRALVLLLGCSLGCLALTKGTGLVLGAPVAAFAAARLARRGLLPLATAVLLAAALNAPHVQRNLRAFGSPYGDEALAHGERVSNELLTPAGFASNLSRNLARQAALPLPAWNRALQRGVLWLHARLGLSPDDPRTTYRRPPWNQVLYLRGHEDVVTAPAHLLLALVAPLALAELRRRESAAAAGLLWLLAAVAFLSFCVLLKWQLWHGRLLVPLVALGAPVLAVAYSAHGARVAAAVLLVTTAGALPALNVFQRPLLGPSGLAPTDRAGVHHHGGLPASQIELVREAVVRTQPRVVGLLDDSYAWMGLVTELLGHRPRFSSFNGRFNPNELREPAPDLVLGWSSLPDRIVHAHSGRSYILFQRSGTLAVYVPDTTRSQPGG